MIREIGRAISEAQQTQWFGTVKFSCITTVFNEGKLLLRSVNSLLAQTHSDFELIIVADGSGPETLAILDTLADPRILIIRQANDGLSAARNKALEQVSGDYVCFLDADDCRPTWALAAMAAKIAEEEPDLLFCRGSLSEVDGRLLPFYDTEQIMLAQERLSGGPANISQTDPETLALMHLIEPQVANKAVRADFLRQHGLWFPNGHFFEDIYFHTMAIAAAERISILDVTCFTYFRRYQAQITAARGDTRFDVIGVARLTLEMFAKTAAFQSPLQRAAALASCAKLVRWCGDMISHHHRFAYSELAKVLFRNMDPAYADIPGKVGPGLTEIQRARDYMTALGILDHFAHLATSGERAHEPEGRSSLLRRLWAKR